MKKILLGTGIDRMPDIVFRFMKILFAFFYLFKNVRKDIERFGIKKGDSVADWGCGTGAYTRAVSEKTGPTGKVYAVDVHELSIDTIKKIIKKRNLTNVIPVISDGIRTSIEDNSVDIVFALDMFHMVRNTDAFLEEVSRLTRPGGSLYLENGHQSRVTAREKVLKSGCWKIASEDKRFMICSPLK